jgi:hypothetical protein
VALVPSGVLRRVGRRVRVEVLDLLLLLCIQFVRLRLILKGAPKLVVKVVVMLRRCRLLATSLGRVRTTVDPGLVGPIAVLRIAHLELRENLLMMHERLERMGVVRLRMVDLRRRLRRGRPINTTMLVVGVMSVSMSMSMVMVMGVVVVVVAEVIVPVVAQGHGRDDPGPARPDRAGLEVRVEVAQRVVVVAQVVVAVVVVVVVVVVPVTVPMPVPVVVVVMQKPRVVVWVHDNHPRATRHVEMGIVAAAGPHWAAQGAERRRGRAVVRANVAVAATAAAAVVAVHGVIVVIAAAAAATATATTAATSATDATAAAATIIISAAAGTDAARIRSRGRGGRPRGARGQDGSSRRGHRQRIVRRDRRNNSRRRGRRGRRRRYHGQGRWCRRR